MNKLARLIAAVHASVLVTTGLSMTASAQDAAEVRAYMEAVRAGTSEAVTAFLQAYPESILPGSELGARIAASLNTTSAAVPNGHRAAGKQGLGHTTQTAALY